MIDRRSLKMIFHGVRGSRPVHHQDFLQTGGNTTCIEIDTQRDYHLIVDGGTGLAKLGYRLGEQLRHKRFHILITHTHWDHLVTIPYFMPLFNQDAHITFYATNGSNGRFEDIFHKMFAGTHLPYPGTKIKAKVDFVTVKPNETFVIENHVRVEGHQLNHQAVTLGYKITSGKSSVVIITDNAPMISGNYLGDGMKELVQKIGEENFHKKYNGDLVAFLRGVHTVVYDTHFNDDNLKPDWGHSTPAIALDLCRQAKAQRLLMFHHAPEDNDKDVIEKMHHIHREALAAGIEVLNAKEEDEWILKSA